MDSPRLFSKLMGAALALLAGALILSVLLPVPAGPKIIYAGVGPPPAKPAPDSSMGASPKIKVEEAYGRLPLYFIENRGQVDRRVNLYAQAGGQTVWFTRDGVYFSFGETTAPKRAQEKFGRKTAPTEIRQPKVANQEYGRSQVVRLTPLGMSPKRELLPLEPQEARVNYLRGNNPDTWRTDIPTYRAVLYREAYPGIDLKFYGAARQMEYDIIVKPGADPGQVRFRYAGIRKLEITGEGDLAIKLPGGRELLQKKPLVYQEMGGQRVTREAKFRIHRDTARQVFGFEVAAYDPRYPLVIDPLVLVYSTFLGGTLSEASFSIAVDGSGCAYVTGDTYSTDFLLQNAYQDTYKGNIDTFVTKFSADGQSLVYSTFLGGNGRDLGKAIALDASGSAHITGQTESSNFPICKAYQPNSGGGYSDVFVTKLSPAGNSLVYSTYLGGSNGYDTGYGIAVDGSGSAYVTGNTESANFPTKDPYQGTRHGSQDAFVSKFDSAGSLVFSTFLGGSAGETGHGIAVDGSGSAYVTGSTNSDDFPTQTPYQGAYAGGNDAFVTKFSPDGQTLVYSTYLGGNNHEYVDGSGLAVDGRGCAYVTGYTYSHNFPLQNPYQGSFLGVLDAFVTKFSPGGDSLVYSTYLGGVDQTFGQGIAVASHGCAYITGHTDCSNFPARNAYQGSIAGAFDAFVTKLSLPATNTPALFLLLLD